MSQSPPRRPRLGMAESQFLLQLLRGDDPTRPGPGFNWPAFAYCVASDGLAPLLYHRLKDQPALVPPDVLEELRRRYYQNVSVNHLRLQELRRLGRRLGAVGIRLMALKGGALALTVYDDPALRFMGDLDTAVPPAHAAAALDLLLADGYQLLDKTDDLTMAALMHREGWHLRLARQVMGKRLELELHWPLRGGVLVNQVARLDVRQLWATAVPLDPTDNLWQPSPPFMLFHLCLHTGLHHRFSDLGLRQYVDIDRVVRRHGDDPGFWPAFVQLARQARAAHACAFVLQLTRDLLGTPLPNDPLADLQPTAVKRRWFAGNVAPSDVVDRTRHLYGRRRLWWRWLTADRLSHLLAGPWGVLFPGRAYLSDYYDSQHRLRLAGYALWHPFHALARAGRRRLRLLLIHSQSITAQNKK